MKKILILSAMSLLALSTMSCKDNNSNKEDNYDDVNIFFVQSKTETVTTSQEDATWRTCAYKQSDKSQFYINKYIYKYGNFSTSVGLIQEKNPAESHDNPYIGLPVPLEDHELLEKEFDVQTFCISFHPIHKELAIVSPVAYDLAGEKVIKSSDRIFMKISKQNNDLDYNQYYWKDAKYSYIPTDFINIECLQDFDASHPKGAMLNDITEVYYTSAEPFIQSRYTNRRFEDGCRWANKPELLSKFNAKNVNLIENLSFSLYLNESPTKSGIYQFKITYKDVSGQQQSAITIPIRIYGKE